MTTEIQEYSKTEAALAELGGRYKGVVYDVTTTAGMKAAVAGRAELRGLRVELEATRKQIKEPALRRCQQIDSEAKRITGELLLLERPIDEQIKKEEDRKEAEKAAKIEAERQRIAGIQDKIAAINAVPAQLTGKSSLVIGTRLAELQAMEVTAEAFAEFEGQALAALQETCLRVASMRDAQAEHEAEQDRIRGERAELERLRAEAAEREKADAARAAAERAEADAAAAEARAKADAEAQAERDRLASEQAERLAAEEAERQAQRQRDEEARAEQQRQEDARRAAEAEQLRKDREAAAAERARLEAEQLANVTLHDAAQSAHSLLVELGQASHLVTRTLAAALSRDDAEPAKAAA